MLQKSNSFCEFKRIVRKNVLQIVKESKSALNNESLCYSRHDGQNQVQMPSNQRKWALFSP